MSDNSDFLHQVIAARRAAWFVFLIAVGFQIFTYLCYLGLDSGAFNGLIESGLYGDITPEELSRIVFIYISAMKLMNMAIFFTALFLTLWVRGLRRIN